MATPKEMSRMSIASFLTRAKRSLARSLNSNGSHPASFVIGNESADLDSILSALLYGYIQSQTPSNQRDGRYIIPVTNISSSQLRLRPELTALLRHANLKPSDLLTLDDLGAYHDNLRPSSTEWALVDHNVFLGSLGKYYSDRVIAVIDHHDDEGKVAKDAQPRIIKTSGSCCSHVINHCQQVWDSTSSPASASGDGHSQGHAASDDVAYTSTLDAQLAKLALGPILIDTVNMKAERKVTDHDRRAVEYLETKINVSSGNESGYDRDAFFQEINDAKSDLDELTVEEILEKDYKAWSEGDLMLGISSCVRSIQYLQSKKQDLMPILLKFAHTRDLDLFAIMTAHNENATFERQLLLLAVEDGPGVKVAKTFAETNADELQLHESSTKVDASPVSWLELWEQSNVSASRKRVAPLLREVMRQ